MGKVCPWWLAYTFDNPLRRIYQKPENILSPYVLEGMHVADIGCDLGYFSLALARMVKKNGKVLAVDLQPQMLSRLTARAFRAGLSSIIQPRMCRENDLGFNEPLDFALAFWVVHETPDPEAFFRQVDRVLKPSATLLFTEPLFHVNRLAFRREISAALNAGFILSSQPEIRWCHAAALTRNPVNRQPAP